ncbi:MAG: hypothetical protein Q7U38_17720 [Methylobacter sp.]|nr:hypothetical protein [Methylobacter sp.]MDP2097584.1 hypothetical protein [Methylobacter sp.]MDP2428281.1 hypothetical protein [Methylobacter sp.]MDP3054995.1 hypothetical protein [Methylobacter sp.]MDP3362914.1 hypothetical protein [Methylobacter sp.]
MNTIMPRFFSSLLEEIPEEVTRLASELHYQRSQNITIEVLTPISFSPKQVDELYYIEGNELKFTSIEARNHCTAAHGFRKFYDSELPLDARKIFDEAHQLWIQEIGHTDFTDGRFLGSMSEKLNILNAGIEIIANSDAHNVFDVLRSIGNALPFLANVRVVDIVELATVQHSKTSGDMLAGTFFNQLSDYLSAHPHLARELYALVREDMSEANTNLYSAALSGLVAAGQALEAVKLAMADTDSASNERVAGALWVLGRLSHHWEKEPNLKNRVQETLKAMGYHSDSNVSLQAWLALSNAAVSQPELVAELLLHAQPGNQAALQVLGSFVFMNLKIVKDHLNLAEMLDALTNLDAGLANDFDSSLSRLIETGIHDQLVYDCLTAWILKHYNTKTSDEKLSSCFSRSLSKLVNKLLLYELITRWLISDERVLGAAYSELIGHLWVHGVKHPVFAKDILDTLNADDFKYLVRRLIGWTFYEEALLSLTFSLLETNEAQQRTFGWVHALLVNEVGRSYPHATLKTIQEKLKGASIEVEELLKSAHAELLTYTEAINQLPIRHELHPPIPERIRHAVALKKSRESRDARDKADEQSIWQQIYTKIQLKAGTGSFSIYDGKIGSINRLGSHSHSFTLPAQYVINPLNDEITKLGLRLAKRGDE